MSEGFSPAARIAVVCAAAAAVFVAWLLTDPNANAGIGFFYAIPVGMAAWWGGRRWCVVAVVGCASLYVLGDLIQPVENFGVALSTRVLAFLAVAAVVTFLRERVIVLEHSAEELETIRAALTPSRLPELPDVDAAAAFVPSEYGVSGDFYLLTNGADGSSVAIVGDVVGHGPRAARLATFIRARFAAFAANTSDPAELLMLANQALMERSGDRPELVSAACVRLESQGGRLSWAVAGHPPPLRLPELEELPRAGTTFLLGADGDLSLRNAEIPIGPEGGVMIYTDGATDVRREGKPFGLDGLLSALTPLSRLPAKPLAEGIQAAILGWTDEAIRDDLCLLVLRPKNALPG
jgi:serine phosphatase RsbU (regulator of sigma subunit)